jgi:hypothetical protein
VIWVLDANQLGDAFQFLPSRVSGRKVPLNVVEQARHLTEQVIAWCEVQKQSLCSIEVAKPTLDK